MEETVTRYHASISQSLLSLSGGVVDGRDEVTKGCLPDSFSSYLRKAAIN